MAVETCKTHLHNESSAEIHLPFLQNLVSLSGSVWRHCSSLRSRNKFGFFFFLLSFFCLLGFFPHVLGWWAKLQLLDAAVLLIASKLASSVLLNTIWVTFRQWELLLVVVVWWGDMGSLGWHGLVVSVLKVTLWWFSYSCLLVRGIYM